MEAVSEQAFEVAAEAGDETEVIAAPFGEVFGKLEELTEPLASGFGIAYWWSAWILLGTVVPVAAGAVVVWHLFSVPFQVASYPVGSFLRMANVVANFAVIEAVSLESCPFCALVVASPRSLIYSPHPTYRMIRPSESLWNLHPRNLFSIDCSAN